MIRILLEVGGKGEGWRDAATEGQRDKATG